MMNLVRASGSGCDTLVAALGAADPVRRHLDADAGCIRVSVSEEWFPKQDPRAGGTIYIWMLGGAPHTGGA